MRDKRKQGKNSGVIPEQDSDVKYFNPESQSRRDFLECQVLSLLHQRPR
jgi:hypothetical protein